jgi:hypothetical protein
LKCPPLFRADMTFRSPSLIHALSWGALHHCPRSRAEGVRQRDRGQTRPGFPEGITKGGPGVACGPFRLFGPRAERYDAGAVGHSVAGKVDVRTNGQKCYNPNTGPIAPGAA